MLKQYIEVPLPMSCGFFDKQWLRLKGFSLPPLYIILAHIAGAPGIEFRLRCIITGTILLFTRRAPRKICQELIFSPMDSTRYFEFHEVWKRVSNFAFTQYLDVSSPRLIPLFLLKTRQSATAKLVNPDPTDLRKTKDLANSLRLKPLCKFFNSILKNTDLIPSSFDLITCLSVLEHIPEDKAAIKTMWTLLKPGGKLILTLPCMSHPLEQYISHNHYEILNSGKDGYTFWQRYYDNKQLESSIYSITGTPTYISVYGEKKKGLFFRNTSMKRLLGPFYPFWREPYMMATEFKYFSSVDKLPGEGVIMLEFVKQEEKK